MYSTFVPTLMSQIAISVADNDLYLQRNIGIIQPISPYVIIDDNH